MTDKLKNWSATAGDNTDTPPDGWPEGMAPSQVNNVARQNMASVREWYQDPEWVDLGYNIIGGSGDTVTIAGDLTYLAIAGRALRINGADNATVESSSFDSSNTAIVVSDYSFGAPPTSVEFGVPAEAVRRLSNGTTVLIIPEEDGPLELTGDFDITGDINITGGAINIDGEPAGQEVTGVIKMYAGSSAPDGFLICNGAAVDRTTYADLFALVGTTYGAGNGSTTFNLPDLRGRTPIGVGTGAGLTTRALAATGGAETHALTAAEGPQHSHVVKYYSGGVDGGGNPRVFAIGTGGQSGNTQNSGSGDAHNNMQPFIAINYIIKT